MIRLPNLTLRLALSRLIYKKKMIWGQRCKERLKS